MLPRRTSIPDTANAEKRCPASAEQFAERVKREAAYGLFREGAISSGVAAQWLGVPRAHFLLDAMRHGATLPGDPDDDFRRETDVRGACHRWEPDMTAAAINLPDEAFSALKQPPSAFVGMHRAAAIHWYARGEISMEKAALIADMDRADFLAALAVEQVDVFEVDLDGLRRKLARG